MIVDRILDVYKRSKSYLYKEFNLKPMRKAVDFNINYFDEKDKYLVLFVHYDAQNIISENDLCYVEELSSIGDLIFITNSCVDIDAYNALEICAKKIIKRKNIGFDFGAWKDAITANEKYIMKYDYLVLANNSVFAPIYNLKKVFSEMNSRWGDFWGITAFTENNHCVSNEAKFFPWDRVPFHIQSYFLVFNKNVISSECFIKFWKTLKYPSSFVEAVQYGEIELSQILLANGYQCNVFIEETLSSTTYHCDGPDLTKNEPDTLIFLGCPFIKKKSLPRISHKQLKRIKEFLEDKNGKTLKFVLDYCLDMHVSKLYKAFNYLFERFVI